MKTVGQIISQTRKQQNISLEKLSQITKIDLKYLKALEKDQYNLLPSNTFVKGFIRNVAQSLGKNPDELIAIFRRDFSQPSSLKLSPAPLKSKENITNRKIKKPSTIILLAVLIFFIYLLFQLRVFITPPKLEIYQPKDNNVLVSPVTIEGKTSPDSIVQVNQDNIVKPDSSGYFILSIPLPLGENEVEIEVTNRFNKSNKQTILVTLVTQ